MRKKISATIATKPARTISDGHKEYVAILDMRELVRNDAPAVMREHGEVALRRTITA